MTHSSAQHRPQLTWLSRTLWSSHAKGRSQQLRSLIFTAVARESRRCSLLSSILDVRCHSLLLSPSLDALALRHNSGADAPRTQKHKVDKFAAVGGFVDTDCICSNYQLPVGGLLWAKKFQNRKKSLCTNAAWKPFLPTTLERQAGDV